MSINLEKMKDILTYFLLLCGQKKSSKQHMCYNHSNGCRVVQYLSSKTCLCCLFVGKGIKICTKKDLYC